MKMDNVEIKINLGELIRDSETLRIVRDYVKGETFISRETLLTILGEKRGSNNGGE